MALVPLLADYLMVLYGWRGSYILLGALMGHLIPTTMMVDINLESDVQDTRSSNAGASDEQSVQMDHEVNDDNDSDSRRLLDEASSHSIDTAASGSVHNPDHSSSGEDNFIEEQDEPVDEVDEEVISDETRLLEESSLRHRHTTASDNSRGISEATSRTKYANLYDTACQILKNSVYNRDRWLIHLMLVTLVYSMVNGTWNGFLIPRAVDRGFATPVAVSFAYSAAVGAFIGRFFGGFILGLKFFSGQEWFLFLTIVNISSLIADIFVARFGVMIVTSFITCLTLAERSTLILVICTDRVTESEFPVILASSEIVFGIGTFIGASLGGL